MSNEPRVSDEDRDKAIDVAYDAADAKHDRVHQPYMGCCSVVGIPEAVDALVSHGWGPKPTVSPAKIDELIVDKWPVGAGSLANHVRAYLRECGIEVTDE